jgi:hypothetical protein
MLALRTLARQTFALRTLAVGTLAVALASGSGGLAPLAAQQTIGPVTLGGGFGAGFQPRSDFSSLGPNFWVGAETVLDRRVRVRLDYSYHRFGYANPPIAACPRTSYCAPVQTNALQLGVISGTLVWRDTTGARRWYALAGLGAYSAYSGRDANSRLGLTGGIGREVGASRSFFIEGRVHLPYDGNGYGVFVPVSAGWNFGHFVP